MKPVKSLQPRGETNLSYIVLGILIALAVLFVAKYYNDHRNDVTIHPPHIEVH